MQRILRKLNGGFNGCEIEFSSIIVRRNSNFKRCFTLAKKLNSKLFKKEL
jgi:hypothetical protein